MEDIRTAYSGMLEQLASGNMDDHFVEYANSVYSFAMSVDEDFRRQMAAELHDALAAGIGNNIGLVPPMYSYLLHLDAAAVYMENMLKILRSIQKICQLEWQNAWYLFAQLNHFRLQHVDCDVEDNRAMLSELIHRAVIKCMRQLNVAISPKLYKERRAEHVVVLTEEFTQEKPEEMEHVLSCCYQLQHDMAKKVLLINTAEAASRAGELNFFGAVYGIEDADLCGQTEITYKGEQIEYMQCVDVLSDLARLEDVLKRILEYNPGMVFHIGDNSFLAGVVDEWIPVMTMGRTHGRLVVSGAEFQAAYDSREEMQRKFFTVVQNHEQKIQVEYNLKVRLVFPADYFKDEMIDVNYYMPAKLDSFVVTKERKMTWAVELDLLAEVRRICEKYDIAYYAYKGTLLGAVRHQGFIPWDDDIDIAMTREDYRRFAAFADEELGEDYRLMDAASVPEWEEFKIRILCASDIECLLGGESYETVYLPLVDICVLDDYPDNDQTAERLQKDLKSIFELAHKVDEEETVSDDSIKEFERLKNKLCCKVNENASMKNQLAQMQQQVTCRYTERNSAKLFEALDYYDTKRLVWYPVSRESFKNRKQLNFENQQIPVPEAVQDVLTVHYGATWQEPYSWLNVTAAGDKKQKIYLEKELSGKAELMQYKENFFEQETVKIEYSGFALKTGFYVEHMMKCAWAGTLKVLKEIERICKRHKIPYFADWGTMLGAVRHKGYVPWDDDIDISMKREDYNQFMVYAREELPKGYCLVDGTFDESWLNSMPRVLNLENQDEPVVPCSEKREEFFGCPFVLGIDVTPLDYIPRDKDEAEIQLQLLTQIASVYLELVDSGDRMTEDISKRLEELEELCKCHFTKDSSLIHQVLRLGSAIAQSYGSQDGDELTYAYSYVKSRSSYRLKKEWYEKTVSFPFEGTTVELPEKYMDVMKVCYGYAWNILYNGGGAHDYPFYKKQLAEFEKNGITV